MDGTHGAVPAFHDQLRFGQSHNFRFQGWIPASANGERCRRWEPHFMQGLMSDSHKICEEAKQETPPQSPRNAR